MAQSRIRGLVTQLIFIFFKNLACDAPPRYSGQLKRDVQQSQKRGKDMDTLKRLLHLLIEVRAHANECATTGFLVAGHFPQCLG